MFPDSDTPLCGATVSPSPAAAASRHGSAETVPRDGQLRRILRTRIDELGLSTRSHNSLLEAHVYLIGDLVRHREKDLLRITNFGRKALCEVQREIQRLGLHLGSVVDESFGDGSTITNRTPTCIE